MTLYRECGSLCTGCDPGLSFARILLTWVRIVERLRDNCAAIAALLIPFDHQRQHSALTLGKLGAGRRGLGDSMEQRGHGFWGQRWAPCLRRPDGFH